MKNKILAILPFLLVLAVSSALATGNYNVERGDTLSEIARDHSINLKDLIETNKHIENPNLIFPGDIVYFPEANSESDPASMTISDRITVKGSGFNIQTAERATQTTTTTEEAHAPEQSNDQAQNVTSAERDLLARIIFSEARGESYTGKVAVGHVVLNRVSSDQFPDSIEKVIYQRAQFQPVSNGAINQKPGRDSIRAAEEVLQNWGDNRGSLYFYNPDIATSAWIFTRENVKVIGNHVFAR